MRIIKLGKVGFARIYTNLVDEAVYESQNILEISMHSWNSKNRLTIFRSIEIFVPRGARALYGLLGGCYKHDASSTLKVSINYDDSTGRLYSGSLAKNVDEVSVGLPEVFAKAALKGIEEAQKKDTRLNSGHINLNMAAYGNVGSSEFVFKRIGSILAKLYSVEETEILEGDIENILRI